MRDLIDRLTREFKTFVDQRDDLLLVASCAEPDVGIAAKVLRDLDRASPSDLMLILADDFSDAESFVTQVGKRFQEELRIARESAEMRGEEELPPELPAELLAAKGPPAKRLHQLMDFSRTLVPPQSGHRVVWAFFPAKIANRRAYMDLASSCAPHGTRDVETWMRGLRLIFRAEADFAFKDSPLVDAERTRLTRVDFSPPALEASLKKVVENPRLPSAERMDALLTIALLDAAYDRHQQANVKLKQLLDFHRRAENPLMQAVVMNGLGDVAYRRKDLKKAQYWFECAIKPAGVAEQPMILATIAQNLGAIAYEQKKFADAEDYYHLLFQARESLLDEDGMVVALEWRGLSQEQQRKWQPAQASWEHAEVLCRAFELNHRLRPTLENLSRVYRQLRNQERLKEVERELKEAARG